MILNLYQLLLLLIITPMMAFLIGACLFSLIECEQARISGKDNQS